MFTITLGFTTDTDKAPVILAGPDVPYQEQEEDMNAAARADKAPASKGKPITRVEIWHSNRPKLVFTFQDPAVKEMLAKAREESDLRAAAAAESERQARLTNLRNEIAKLESPAEKAEAKRLDDDDDDDDKDDDDDDVKEVKKARRARKAAPKFADPWKELKDKAK